MRSLLRLSILASVALICGGVSLYFAPGSRAQTAPVTAGQVIISELRYRGPNGPQDEFIELYNNTNSAIVVSASDQSSGWAVVASNAQITGNVCIIPNGTVIPARGHLLCANTDAEAAPGEARGYSLNEYPSGNPGPTPLPSPAATPTPAFALTTPDLIIPIDIPDGAGIALFSTTSIPNQNAATRLDAFGFTSSPALFREGAGFPTIPTANNEHTLFRDLRAVTPKDTDNNAADFRLVATTGSLQIQLNGSPGPENLRSPIVNHTTISATLLDPTVSQASPPNRVRVQTPETNAPLGTILIRRTITNNTGQPISRLRFRVNNITTRGTPASECGGTPCADVRALDSPDGMATLANSTVVVVRGVRLEDDPPLTPEGGGLNATVSADFINLSTPLAPGASINIELKIGVVTSGPFRYMLNIEALNSPPPIFL
jgi:hypothetical protein